jgi:hypothetical protein
MSTSQDVFTAALRDATQPVPQGLIDGANHPAGQRFNVYRNNITVSLIEAMHAGFPVIAKLLGQQNMDGLTRIYQRTHPPSSPLMMQYGGQFPAFLAETEQLAHLAYLPDVARLELAIRHAYHAADISAISPEMLAGLSADTLTATTLTFAPAVQIIRSDWPLFDIWKFNTEADAPKPQHGSQDVLITRPEFDPIPQLLPPGAAAWILGLMKGQSIGFAHDAALADTADFDLAEPLALLLQGGAIVSLNPRG